MPHRHKGRAGLLAALLLTAALPAAAMEAAGSASPAAVADTPLGVNLLKNGGFDKGPAGRTADIPGWTRQDDVYLEKFGTRAFPSVAYGKKYKGGANYLTCGKVAGLVRQSVPWVGTTKSGQNHDSRRARLQVDFGGVKGNLIRAEVRALDADGKALKTSVKTKTLDITNHYKQIVASMPLPVGTARIEGIIKLMPKPGESCKMDADSAVLEVIAQ